MRQPHQLRLRLALSGRGLDDDVVGDAVREGLRAEAVVLQHHVVHADAVGVLQVVKGSFECAVERRADAAEEAFQPLDGVVVEGLQRLLLGHVDWRVQPLRLVHGVGAARKHHYAQAGGSVVHLVQLQRVGAQVSHHARRLREAQHVALACFGAQHAHLAVGVEASLAAVALLVAARRDHHALLVAQAADVLARVLHRGRVVQICVHGQRAACRAALARR